MSVGVWWQRGVIYQIYPRSFQDSNRDGVGDLLGILARVDYLAQLGVDAVWLSPFYPSPMADFGYDVSNYTDIHPLFGTLQDFDRLLTALHAREIKLIIDFVPNHSSDQHPWFLESRSSQDNPKRDWYIWRDPKPDGSPPNNWLSLFGGSAWEWDDATSQYYLHSFLKEQPDLNWRNPEVRQAMYDAMRFWLDRGVDGFRIDVAHLILKDPELRDNPPSPPDREAWHKPVSEFDRQLHVYDKGHADVHGAFREMRSILDSYSREQPRMAVGEIHEFDMPIWTSYYGAELDELHMPFNFGLLRVPWQADEVRRLVDTIEGHIPAGAWPNYVLGNHDETRIASRVGDAQARIAMMLLLTLRGTPTMYYGDEIGMRDVEIPDESIQDPWGKNVPGLGLGRDPQRTPMQWDDSPNAGFCDEDIAPWLPIGASYRTINVRHEESDEHSMLSLTRRLLDLRSSSEALTAGAYRPVEGPHETFAYTRESGEHRLLVALNFTASEVEVPCAEEGRMLLSTQLDNAGNAVAGTVRLRPNEGCVIELTGEASA